MGFLNLWALWIAAGAVPTLLILYFLKLRRREQAVSTTLLWKRAVQDMQVNAPFQKLRKNLLLFLQLLVLAAAILALARPIVESTATPEARVVFLIDRSASMNTLEEGDRTRLDLAKEQAIRRARTYNRTGSSWFSFSGAAAGTEIMVVAFADRATIVAPFSRNIGEIVDLIERIEPSDARTDIREALQLAEAYMAPAMLNDAMAKAPVGPDMAARVVLISDGRVPPADLMGTKSAALEWIPIGAATDNVAITALRTQRNYEDPELLSAFLQVANYGSEAVRTDVSIYADGRIIDVKSVALSGAPPRDEAMLAMSQPSESGASSASLSFDVRLDRAARIEARLSRRDALAADNTAYAVVPAPRKLRVLVVTQGNDFIDSALRGLPLQEFIFATPEQYRADPTAYQTDGADARSRFDVVIWDKISPENVPVGSHLYFGALPPEPDIKPLGEMQNVAPVWWAEDHAALRHVQLDFVSLSRATKIDRPKDATVLIDGREGPLLFQLDRAGRRHLVMTFVVENRAWWSRPTFPIFLYNALRFLGGADAERVFAAGETVRLVAPPGETELTIQPPAREGQSRPAPIRMKTDVASQVFFGRTERTGFYEVAPAVDASANFAVNLEDPWESDVAPPRGDPTLGPIALQRGRAIRASTPEVWRWFVGAALLVALIEWYIYNRRVML